MATNIEKLVHPLTWSGILPKNSRSVDSKPFNEDKSSLNTTTKDILIQCGWKIVDHGLNWNLKNWLHIPEKKRFCLNFFIQYKIRKIIFWTIFYLKEKKRPYFRCDINHDMKSLWNIMYHHLHHIDDPPKSSFRCMVLSTKWSDFSQYRSLLYI